MNALRVCGLLAAMIVLDAFGGGTAPVPGSVVPAGKVTLSPPGDDGTLRLTVAGAILMAVENNLGLAVDRVNPAIKRTFEQQERAAFDPVLSAQASQNLTRQGVRTTGTGTAALDRATQAEVSLKETLPTGTAVELTGSTEASKATGSDRGYASRLGLTATQALLRGFGTDVNLASLRQSQLDTRYSEYELRGTVQALVADAETAYWDVVLADRQVAITRESLQLAQDQLRESQERISVGKLAAYEQVAAEAEVALRRQALIDADNQAAVARLTLLRLLNPVGSAPWNRVLALEEMPELPTDLPGDDVEAHVELAGRMRPELNQARLQLERQELELVKTRNGLLPQLDLFITLGGSSYADSFGRAYRDLNGRNYDLQAGLKMELPLGNRDARAKHERAGLNRDQAMLSLRNLTQLAEVDVRKAFLELRRAGAQVQATAATRRLQEEKLRYEREKFRVGKSTALAVGQAQRDLLSSQVDEIQASANHLKACIALYRQEGSLLDYRGIDCPGQTPVSSPP